jgi:hypothetical protein
MRLGFSRTLRIEPLQFAARLGFRSVLGAVRGAARVESRDLIASLPPR